MSKKIVSKIVGRIKNGQLIEYNLFSKKEINTTRLGTAVVLKISAFAEIGLARILVRGTCNLLIIVHSIVTAFCTKVI